MIHSSPLHVRVAIPHFFREDKSSESFGSSRVGNTELRSFSLYSCLSSILAQSFTSSQLYLDLAKERVVGIDSSPSGPYSIDIEVNVFVCGTSFIDTTLSAFSSLINIHHVDLAEPRDLPKYVSQWLVHHPCPCDLNYFSEDDIVLHDSQYFQKQNWFLSNTDYQFVLMPHRYEFCVSRYPQKLYVDGPNTVFKDPLAAVAHEDRLSTTVVSANYPGFTPQLSFVFASNPHSGTFTVRREQLSSLKSVSDQEMNFISPLESASSGLVRARYPVLKPSWPIAHFLEVCHSNPSFLAYVNRWPHV